MNPYIGRFDELDMYLSIFVSIYNTYLSHVKSIIII